MNIMIPEAENNTDRESQPQEIVSSIEIVRAEISRISEKVEEAVAEQVIGDATWAVKNLANANEQLARALRRIEDDEVKATQYTLEYSLQALANGRRLSSRFSNLFEYCLADPDKPRGIKFENFLSLVTDTLESNFEKRKIRASCQQLLKMGFIEKHGRGNAAQLRPTKLALSLLREGKFSSWFDLGLFDREEYD